MRASTVAFYTLAVLASRDVTNPATASPEPVRDRPNDDSAPVSPSRQSVEPDVVAAVLPPETTPLPEFQSTATASTEPAAALSPSAALAAASNPEADLEWSPHENAADVPLQEDAEAADALSSESPQVDEVGVEEAIAPAPPAPPPLITNAVPAASSPSESLQYGVTQLPTLPPRPLAGTSFPDIRNHWARDFIEPLALRNIVEGFPDGTFRPNDPLTRAQFSAMIRQAFQVPFVREARQFTDVPADYWAADAINNAYRMDFFNGYPQQMFFPEQNITRTEVLVSMTDGLDLVATELTIDDLDDLFQDAEQIPTYAPEQITEATEHELVVNYPDVRRLRPTQISTRAEAAAVLYQALVHAGALPELSPSNPVTDYIVGYDTISLQPSLAELREQYLLPEPPVVEVATARAAPLGMPAFTIGSPTAFGADWGEIFFGTTFQERARFTNRSDGAIAFGFGLGDAQDAVGLEVTFSVVDLFGDEAFEDGGVSLKLHRQFEGGWAIAAGVENLFTFGSTDGGSSGYGVVSKVFQLRDDPTDPFSTLTASLGLGGGRFRSELDLDEDRINAFGSVGVQVVRPLALIADWTGQDLNLGVSIAPFRNFPLVITPAAADVTNNAGDGVRFILGVGLGYQF